MATELFGNHGLVFFDTSVINKLRASLMVIIPGDEWLTLFISLLCWYVVMQAWDENKGFDQLGDVVVVNHQIG